MIDFHWLVSSTEEKSATTIISDRCPFLLFLKRMEFQTCYLRTFDILRVNNKQKKS